MKCWQVIRPTVVLLLLGDGIRNFNVISCSMLVQLGVVKGIEEVVAWLVLFVSHQLHGHLTLLQDSSACFITIRHIPLQAVPALFFLNYGGVLLEFALRLHNFGFLQCLFCIHYGLGIYCRQLRRCLLKAFIFAALLLDHTIDSTKLFSVRASNAHTAVILYFKLIFYTLCKANVLFTFTMPWRVIIPLWLYNKACWCDVFGFVFHRLRICMLR